MAIRPAWTIKDGKVIREGFEFAWNGGFAVTQKQKNIKALHQAILDTTGGRALEISTKGLEEPGNSLSAFNLTLGGNISRKYSRLQSSMKTAAPIWTCWMPGRRTPKETRATHRPETSLRLSGTVTSGRWSRKRRSMITSM